MLSDRERRGGRKRVSTSIGEEWEFGGGKMEGELDLCCWRALWALVHVEGVLGRVWDREGRGYFCWPLFAQLSLEGSLFPG